MRTGGPKGVHCAAVHAIAGNGGVGAIVLVALNIPRRLRATAYPE